MKNYLQPSLFILALAISIGISQSSFGQAVSINATGTAPDAQSILDISSTDKGVLLPRLANHTDVTPTGGSDFGLTVYDLFTSSYWYWDGAMWQEIPNTNSIPAVSLDDAYDGGIFITADAGAVDIQGAGGLTVNGSVGIGNTAPDYELDVSGDIGTDNRLYHNDDSNTFLAFTPDRIQLHAGNATDSWIDIQNSAAEIAINEGGVSRDFRVEGGNEVDLLFVDGSTDRIGVATSTPSVEFDVNGQIRMRTGATLGYVPVGDANGVMTWTDPATLGLDETTASNGLYESTNDVRLGGDLTEATEIQLEAFDLTLDLNGTGEFVVQDGNVDHFKIGNNGDAIFGSDTYFKDTNTGGTDLVKISDAGTGGNDGRIEIFKDGTANHTISGDGDVEFNESGADRNFRIESLNDVNMFFLDGGTDRIGVGIGTPSRTLHVDGEARIQGLANAAGAVVLSDLNGNINDLALTGSATDVLLGTGAFGAASTLNDNDWLQVVTSGAPSAVGDWIYTNGNVGINYGSAANPYAALHVKTQAYIGDDNTGSFFNSNAILHLARTNNPHFLMEDVGNNTGGLSFDAGGMNVVTENGDIDFRTGITFNGDFSSTGTSRMIIQNGGNVGIGTLTPDAKLNVGDATGATIYLTREDNTTVTNDVLGSLLFDSTDDTTPSTTDASAGIRAYASQNHGNSNKGGYMTFFTKDNTGFAAAAVEHMRITADGNVGIGTTNPTVKFMVDGDATITGKMNSNGIQESSDRRFKKEIAPLENSLENLMKIEGVSYKWRQDEFPDKKFGDRTEIGVIAQEIEKVYPQLVSTDADGYKAVQYSHLVPVLLEAIKEQQQLIENLGASVGDLGKKLTVSNENYGKLLKQMQLFSVELENVKSSNQYSVDSK